MKLQYKASREKWMETVVERRKKAEALAEVRAKAKTDAKTKKAKADHDRWLKRANKTRDKYRLLTDIAAKSLESGDHSQYHDAIRERDFMRAETLMLILDIEDPIT
jgi:hypothetical protein